MSRQSMQLSMVSLSDPESAQLYGILSSLLRTDASRGLCQDALSICWPGGGWLKQLGLRQQHHFTRQPSGRLLSGHVSLGDARPQSTEDEGRLGRNQSVAEARIRVQVIL